MSFCSWQGEEHFRDHWQVGKVLKNNNSPWVVIKRACVSPSTSGYAPPGQYPINCNKFDIPVSSSNQTLQLGNPGDATDPKLTSW
jgi:hypothetical protein